MNKINTRESIETEIKIVKQMLDTYDRLVKGDYSELASQLPTKQEVRLVMIQTAVMRSYLNILVSRLDVLTSK